jgi:hypothetical protein
MMPKFLNGPAKPARWVVLLLLSTLLPGTGWAQDWQPVIGNEGISRLFTDTVMQATLGDNERATARYYAAGTGELQAWRDTFQREWKVEGDKQACVKIDGVFRCFRIERNTAADNEYRATRVDTGETITLTISEQSVRVEDSDTTDSGGAAAPSADEVAKSLANPNTPLATMTLKLQYRTFDGDLPGADDQSGTMALFQPSFPFSLDGGRMVFFRPAFPIMFDQPSYVPEEGDFDSVAGLGDIGFDLAYGGATKGGVTWATGIISTLPTATKDELGKDRWSLGPEVLLAKVSSASVLGALVTYQTDVGGSGDADISLTTINVFATYLPGGGWNVGSVPIINYDHEADQWTLPLNFQVGKTVIMGGRPWKLSAEANYFIEQPDAFGPQWMLGVSIGPVVKNVMADWFK